MHVDTQPASSHVTPSTRRIVGGSKPICPAIYTVPLNVTPCKLTASYDHLCTTSNSIS